MSGLSDLLSPSNILKGAATVAELTNPIGAVNAVVNKVSGGHIGYDPTPGYNAARVVNTQLANTSINNNAGAQPRPAGNTGQPGTDPSTTYQQQQEAAARAAAAKENALYGVYKNKANTALDDLLGAYNTQKAGIGRQYDVAGNRAQSAFKQAQTDYNKNLTSQDQDLLRQSNQLRQGTSAAYQNLMNLLGAYGGGASSVALNWAPTAAQNFFNEQFGDASQNAASNKAALTDTFGRYQNQFDDERKLREQQEADDLAQAKGTYEGTRSKLMDILSNINNRSVDADVIGSRVQDIADSIPNLQLAKMTYTGKTPTYQAPELSTFVAENAPAAAFQTGQPGNTAANPGLAYLADQRRQNENTPALAYLLNQRRQQNQVTPVV